MNNTTPKVCPVCNKKFNKPSDRGLKTWSKMIYCSRKCFGVSRIGTIYSEERNKKVSLAKMDNKNPAWKGDKVGYKTLHKWIREHKPRIDYCEHCKKIDTKRLVLANINGKYTRDFNNYLWLCDSCHRTFDYRPEAGLKISKALKGRKFTKEHKLKLSVSAYKRWNSLNIC